MVHVQDIESYKRLATAAAQQMMQSNSDSGIIQTWIEKVNGDMIKVHEGLTTVQSQNDNTHNRLEEIDIELRDGFNGVEDGLGTITSQVDELRSDMNTNFEYVNKQNNETHENLENVRIRVDDIYADGKDTNKTVHANNEIINKLSTMASRQAKKMTESNVGFILLAVSGTITVTIVTISVPVGWVIGGGIVSFGVGAMGLSMILNGFFPKSRSIRERILSKIGRKK